MWKQILPMLLALGLSACAADSPPPPPPVETRLVEVPLDAELTADPAQPSTLEAEAALDAAPPNMVVAILLSVIYRQDFVITEYKRKMACIRARQAGEACQPKITVTPTAQDPPA